MIVYHARQQLGRVIGIKIAALHFHTGFVPLQDSTLIFDKNDLDDTPEVGGKFRVVVNSMIGEDSVKFTRAPAPWEAEDASHDKLVPDPLFGSTLEMEETLENFQNSKSTVLFFFFYYCFINYRSEILKYELKIFSHQRLENQNL